MSDTTATRTARKPRTKIVELVYTGKPRTLWFTLAAPTALHAASQGVEVKAVAGWGLRLTGPQKAVEALERAIPAAWATASTALMEWRKEHPEARDEDARIADSIKLVEFFQQAIQ